MAFLIGRVPFATVACTASTPISVVGLKAATNQAVKLLEAKISFDGANSANAPAVVEFCGCTFATNGPGTNSTSVTVQKKDAGRQETVQTTAAKAWSTEPTVITAMDTTDVGQFNGIYHYICPAMAPWVVVGGQGFVIRVTSPNNVNTTGKLEFEE